MARETLKASELIRILQQSLEMYGADLSISATDSIATGQPAMRSLRRISTHRRPCW